jgi:hypothetical protein
MMQMPWTPSMPARGLDWSWSGVLDYAFESRLQFGPQLLFTYGPLGFVLPNQYSPGSFSWVLVFRGSILLLLGMFYFKMLRPLRFIYGVAGAVILLAALQSTVYAMYGSVPVVEALVLFQDDVRPLESVGLALLCGMVGLVEFSYFILITIVFLISALYRGLRWREFPVAAILSGFAMVVLYVMLGHHVRSLWEYLWGSTSMAAGYSEAMQGEGPLMDEVYFVIGAASLLLVVVAYEFKKSGMWSLFPVAALTAVVFMMYKEGFVRHDYGHVWLASNWLVVTIALYTIARSHQQLEGTGAVLLLFAAGCFFVKFGAVGNLPRNMIDNLLSLRELVRHGTRLLDHEYEDAQATIRLVAPLPAIKGDADIYPYDQSVLLANKLSYHPRPVFQSYLAYTRYLTNRNVDFLKSSSAPQTIFFDIATIDNRLPALDDGASWPELLTRYDVKSETSKFLRLDLRGSPRTYKLLPLLKTSIRLGEELQMENNDSLIWAHIQLKKTLLGHLLTTLIKAPLINLELTLRDGSVRVFRLVPGEAAEGFLLSPLVQTQMDFWILDDPALRTYLSPKEVQKIRISPQRFARIAYQDDVAVTLDSLVVSNDVTKQRGALDPVLRRYKELLILDAGQRSGICDLIEGDNGPQMFAHAPSRIVVDAPPADKLIVSFGIRDGAWREGHTDGVEFRISTMQAGANPRPIWSQRLTPLTREADRGLQKASLSERLEPGTRLVFETLPVPGGTNAWAWSYWQDLDFN